MSSEPLRFRQIHLDFHTSEKIPGVGSRFEPKQFQEMLKRGHVDSITLFSKCHHGLSYHQTEVGVRHPTLATELLPRQMEACHEIDVKTPIYISAGFDEAMIREHPEWGVKGKEGGTFNPLRAGYKLLCFNTPYLDYLCAQIEEVGKKFGGHGFFLDIISPKRCYCRWCLDEMEERGIDPRDDVAVDAFAQVVYQKYAARTTASCRKANPEQRVFHNAGHIAKGAGDILKWNSHLELESLPTGGWGYDHFPLSAKYTATTGYEFLGMTGKFHTTWGEFGGFKRAEALRYECAAMQAFGSKCSIGDQLHPSGELSADTYDLIGAAYSEVEEREPWCHRAHPVSEIALVSAEALRTCYPHLASDGVAMFGSPPSEEGAARMLLEMQAQFDVVDLDHDLAGYRLVILPDEFVFEGEFGEKIREYTAGGGKLLLSGKSGLNTTEDAFALDCGLQLIGKSEYETDYLIAGEAMPTAPVRGPFLVNGGAWNVRAKEGAETEILAERADPYFNREWNHFSSHQNTPDEKLSDYPGVIGVRTDGEPAAVYFAHHIFTRYRLYGQPLYRDMVRDAIYYLLGDLEVQVTMPSTGRASLMKQENQNRYILHLLYATPVLRGGHGGNNAWAVEVIEDLVPLDNVVCSVRTEEEIRGVRLVPKGTELKFSAEDGAVSFTVPRVLCGEMVELVY